MGDQAANHRVRVECRCGAGLGRATVVRAVTGETVDVRVRAGWGETRVSADPRLRSDRATPRTVHYMLHRFTCRRCPTDRTVRHETLSDVVWNAAAAGRREIVVGADL